MTDHERMLEVIGQGHKTRKAPKCMVRFICPVCGGESILNAYMGVPTCPIDDVSLEPLTVVRDAPPPDPGRERERTLTPEQELAFASARPPDIPEVDLQPTPRGSSDLEGRSHLGDRIQWRPNGDAPLQP